MLSRHDLALGTRPRGPGWTTVGRGVRRREPATDLQAWQQVLRPTAAFTHLTSAVARGWWLPPLPADLPRWVAQIGAQNASVRAGLVVSRHRAIPDSEVLDGVRFTTAAETLLACARDLGVLDVLVMADGVLHRKEASPDELWTVARQHRRGAPRLREVLALADGRSESAWETMLRTLHVVCGIEVEPQHEVRAPDGTFVARGDLWLVGTDSLHELDGGLHLTRRQQQLDLARGRRIGHAGMKRRGYTSDDVLRRGVTVLRDADRALGRPHDPRRIQVWHDLLRASLFSPAGQAAFRARLAR